MRPAHYSDEDLEQHSLQRRVADSGQRTGFEHDVDRIMYAGEWRSLAGKSQVVASAELGAYHTRLTHSMKVAQLGRRMTERLERQYGGPNPALVEAACMAHDIGHPPFGHAGETALRETMDELRGGDLDSFEGNAQTLHIVSYLASHKYPGHRGLHLTRAGLDAAIKYPWQRTSRAVNDYHFTKWGVYDVDRPAFDWIRTGRTDEQTPVEEQLMDWADDVTYACHDVEDFYRAGLIPLPDLLHARDAGSAESELEVDRFLTYVATKRRAAGRSGPGNAIVTDQDQLRDLLADVGRALIKSGLPSTYLGRHSDDIAINARTAELIDYFTRDLRLEITGSAPIRYQARLLVPPERRAACDLLKELVWCYVIDRPALATQQHGTRRIISELLRWTYEAPQLLPVARKEELEQHGDPMRAAADHVASLTEDQAIALHRRMSGSGLGSLADGTWL